MIEDNDNKDSNNNPTFLDYLDDGNKEAFNEYFKNNENEIYNYKSKEGQTILHIIIEKNSEDLLEHIINNAKQKLSADDFKYFLDSKDINGRTPFHFACYYGNMKIIKFLLKQGVNYNLKGKTGLSCLHFSAMKDKVTPIYYMIKKYKINQYDQDYNGNTFFHWACYCSSERIINFFLNDITFDINIENKDGFIPLHFYIMSRSTNCIKRLMIREADPNKTNKEGKNAMDIVNEIYNKEENKNKKDYILEIFKRKKCSFKYFEFSFFIASHTIFFLYLINRKIIYKKLFLLWSAFVAMLIFRFIKKYYPKENKIKDEDYLLKIIDKNEDKYFKLYDYCIKCQIKQKMYTKHCFYCDKCIKEFDHHCKWLNTCIGKNNKYSFNILISILSINSFIYLIQFFILLNSSKNNTFKLIINIILFLLNLLFFIGINFIICPLIIFFLKKIIKYLNGESNNRSIIESSDSDENTKLLLEDSNK